MRPEASPFSPSGRSSPGTDSFLNHRPLELSKHAHHLKHRLPGGCRGVEPLLAQEEVDLERVQRRCTQVAPYTYLLDEGERLRPVDQPRELFGDNP